MLKERLKTYLPTALGQYENLKRRFHPGHRAMLLYRLTGIKKGRNQWEDSTDLECPSDMIIWSKDEIGIKAPKFHKRLAVCLDKAKGRVLEIGCGSGKMTRWLSASQKVTQITAIDAFSTAVEKLKRYNFSKVNALHMSCENMRFEGDDFHKFDTVLICELIEHLYPDEEKKMLNSLRDYVGPGSHYIVSTPIGWLNDAFHVRGFSKKAFLAHLKKHYGEPLEVDYSSGYSQVAFGRFRA